jgi:hypothetical protein
MYKDGPGVRDEETLDHFELEGYQKIIAGLLGLIMLILLIGNVLFDTPLSFEIIAAFVLATLLFSLSPVIRYIDTVKVGGVEIKFFRGATKQYEREIAELIKRVKQIENQLPDKVPAPVEDLRRRYEEAAEQFMEGDKAQRLLAQNDMVFSGVQLGADFLRERLREGNLGERAGAAASLSTFPTSESIKALVSALEDKSSFVRYRAAESIAKIVSALSSGQIPMVLPILNVAVENLQVALKSEKYEAVGRMMGRARNALAHLMNRF